MAQRIDHPVSVKVLQGPRQVGKTSMIERLKTHDLVLFDDHLLRRRAAEDPALLLDHLQRPAILDEATLVPELFTEIKKRVDKAKRDLRKGLDVKPIDY